MAYDRSRISMPLDLEKRPRCPFCRSRDTDLPYDRPSAVPIVSWIVPRFRRLYCRACNRRFWGLVPKPRSRDASRRPGGDDDSSSDAQEKAA